jgi:hypothetical protein
MPKQSGPANIFLILTLAACLFQGLLACVSTHEVGEDFQRHSLQRAQSTTKKVSVVLILVDGLGADLLSQNLDRTSNLKKYFRLDSTQFSLAHSVFPSLTFPNLMSLLTRTPVNQHSVIGNHMQLSRGEFREPKTLNFESHEDLVWLNNVKESALVFSKLTAQGQFSATFAQSLFSGATVQNKGDLRMANAYMNHDYLYVDTNNIAALKDFLEITPSTELPSFIFLHLIGVDAMAHDFGPFDPRVGSYLANLDRALNPILTKLEGHQTNGTSIATILTADHGFIEVKNVFPLEKMFEFKSQNIMVLNEGRNAALFFDQDRSFGKQTQFIKTILQRPEIDLAAWRENQFLTISTKSRTWTFRFFKNPACLNYQFAVIWNEQSICPEDVERAIDGFPLPPFAFENILSYLVAPQAPDAILIAAEGVSFNAKYKGHHGGISQQETLVPLLLRGVKVRDMRTPSLFEVLKIMPP